MNTKITTGQRNQEQLICLHLHDKADQRTRQPKGVYNVTEEKNFKAVEWND
jgi:hypothetical protein